MLCALGSFFPDLQTIDRDFLYCICICKSVCTSMNSRCYWDELLSKNTIKRAVIDMFCALHIQSVLIQQTQVSFLT